MALDLTPEQQQLGQDNYGRVSEGLTRRRFLKGVAVAGGATIPIGAAMYFGYRSLDGRPVRAALIGGGDEGGVLVGEHNPDFLEFIAVCDLRPYNLEIKDGKPPAGRIFAGEAGTSPRKGFNRIYGKDAEKIRPYRDYK